MKRVNYSQALEFVHERKPCIITDISCSIDLTCCAGQRVMVEELANNKFGLGNTKEMLFSEFMDNIQDGLYYLTTQYELSNSELSDFAAAPLHSIPKLIPPIWDKFPMLVPHQVNLWLGSSTTGTSSGLHHDFHDNVYILMKGTKHFTIFPPSDYDKMYLNGRVQGLHDNGLLVYNDFQSVRDDGAFYSDVAAYKLEMAEIALEKAETESQIALAEEQLDQAMEYSLEHGDHQVTEESHPSIPSFSKADLGDIDSYPLLKNATRLDFELKSGESLYLPTGWFHNVKSKSDDSGTHMALNYWFVPPSAGNKYHDDFFKSRWDRIKEKFL